MALLHQKMGSGRLRALAIWMIPPAKGWRRKSNGLLRNPLFQPLMGLIAILLALGVSGLALPETNHPLLLWPGQLLLLSLALALIVVLLRRINRQLLEPLAHLRNWALRMRGGNLSARIPVPPRGEFAELARDINSLGDSLQGLTQEMDKQVRRQTERLEQKTRSLEVLYDVAASINTSRDLDDLLTRFLKTLTEIVGARAAAVRLLHGDDQMRLVASIGLDPEAVAREREMPVNSCLCGTAVAAGTTLCQADVRQCSAQLGRPLLSHRNLEMIAVPLQYREQTLGVYNLFVEKPGLVQRQELQSLLDSIGQHLGMAIEKSRLDSESQRLSLMRERALLAHELHDSLAQTLASLRFQVKMLHETLDAAGDAGAQLEILSIERGLEEAHTELRELLSHFRVRMDERGLVPAIEDILERFRNDTGIAVFFQRECRTLELPPSHEVQVLRIIQEALANIRKHSHAHTARLLLRCDNQGNYHVLVEDDGVGSAPRDLSGAERHGEHIGLSVMQERARQLAAELNVESEPGEGTRVELTFRYPPTNRAI